MSGGEAVVGVVAGIVLLLLIGSFFLFGNPFYWLGVLLGSGGDPEGVKRGCAAPFKVVGILLALLILLGLVSQMTSGG